METINILLEIIKFIKTHYENVSNVIVKDDLVEFLSNDCTIYLNPILSYSKELLKIEETRVISHVIREM